MTVTEFTKYFSLEEAVGKLPEVKDALGRAHADMAGLRDEIVLQKRLLLARKKSGLPIDTLQAELVKQKYEAFEAAFIRWVEHFAEQGIILRDIEAGLIDFPYRAQSTGQDYFLCWRLCEDGIFYFHEVDAGFSGRHPISLLPD